MGVLKRILDWFVADEEPDTVSRPRIKCSDCGRMVAYSSRTGLTSKHLCKGTVIQRKPEGRLECQ